MAKPLLQNDSMTGNPKMNPVAYEAKLKPQMSYGQQQYN